MLWVSVRSRFDACYYIACINVARLIIAPALLKNRGCFFFLLKNSITTASQLDNIKMICYNCYIEATHKCAFSNILYRQNDDCNLAFDIFD